jgi:hypothetical protein
MERDGGQKGQGRGFPAKESGENESDEVVLVLPTEILLERQMNVCTRSVYGDEVDDSGANRRGCDSVNKSGLMSAAKSVGGKESSPHSSRLGSRNFRLRGEGFVLEIQVVSLDAVFGYQSRLLGQSCMVGSESIRQGCSASRKGQTAGAHAEARPRRGCELVSRDR